MRRFPLALKLGVAHVTLLVAVTAAIWLSIDVLASDYFMTLMQKYDVDAKDVNEMFLSSTQRALLQVGVVAIVVASGASYWMSRRILAPMREIVAGTRRVAHGDYDCRVEIRSRDEFEQLGSSFNDMARSLGHLDASRQRMLVNLGHEVRSPLTNLIGYVEALEDGIVQPSAETYGVLQRELQRLVRLTEDVLATARTDALERRPMTRIDLEPIVGETLALFLPRFARRQVTVETRFDDIKGPIDASADDFRRVLGNLLQNCVQYTKEGGSVRIRAVDRGSFVRLVFSNSSEPLDEQDVARLFEPYYRADKSRSVRTAGGAGAGLGLSIVESIVKAHGGRVGASSCAEATRIWIEMPRQSAA